MINNIPYTLDELYVIASKYTTRNDFRKKSSGAYMSAKRRFPEHFENLCSHMELIIKPKQTLTDIHNEALKYEYFTDFVNNSSSVYTIMRQRFSDKVDFICGHLKRTNHNDEWSLDLLCKEALKYKTKTDFQENSSGAYTIMYRRFSNSVDFICSHMERKGGFDQNKPAILYYLSINNGQAYKIGVTNRSVEQRFNSIDLAKIKVINVVQYSSGLDAYNSEQKILNEFKSFKWIGDALLESGNSELFGCDILNLDRSI